MSDTGNPDAPQITLHNSREEVRTAWQSLCEQGGYALYLDKDGNMHGLRLAAAGIPN